MVSALATQADYDQRTPLHLAATEGFAMVVQRLIEHIPNEGALNAVDRWGGTPLGDALHQGHTSCVKLLREAGEPPLRLRILLDGLAESV